MASRQPCFNILNQRAVFARWAQFAFSAMLCTVLTGCPASVEIEDSGDTTDKSTSKKSASASCEDRLQNAWQQIQPTRAADIQSAVRQLNDWITNCGDEEMTGEPAPEFLTADLRADAEQTRFSERDAEYIRNTVLFRVIADRAVSAASKDTDRILAAFYDVVRTVSLMDDSEWISMSPYECLLLGHGTVADRAWIFAGVLRQMHFEAVVLQPESADVKSWLVGVVVDDKVLLFSPELGIPIPAKADDATTALPNVIATLAEAKSNPQILKQLPVDISADDLKSAEVLVIGASTRWSERTEVLENNLPPEEVVLLFDSPTKNELLGAVAAGDADWSTDSVGIWDYPSRRQKAYAFPDEAGIRSRQQAMEVLDFPFILEGYPGAGGKPAVRIRNKNGALLEARLLQLAGNVSAAVTGRYQQVRGRRIRRKLVVPVSEEQAVSIDVPADIFATSELAISSALFFSGMCQYDRGEITDAINSLRANVRTGKPGPQMDAANYTIAVALMDLGEKQQALNALEKTLHDKNRQRVGNEWLKQRWQGEPADTDSAVETKPAPVKPKEENKTEETESEKSETRKSQIRKSQIRKSQIRKSQIRKSLRRKSLRRKSLRRRIRRPRSQSPKNLSRKNPALTTSQHLNPQRIKTKTKPRPQFKAAKNRPNQRPNKRRQKNLKNQFRNERLKWPKLGNQNSNCRRPKIALQKNWLS